MCRPCSTKKANWLGCKAEWGRSGGSRPDCFLGARRPSASVPRVQDKEFCGTVPAGKFVSRVRPRALCWPGLGPVCYGRSIAAVVPPVLRLVRSQSLSPVMKLGGWYHEC